MKHLFALLTALFLLPATGFSQNAQVDLLPGWRTEAGTHMAGVSIALRPGWKTYWRAPGEAGIPPFFNWSGSTNVASVRVHWPAPTVFWQSGMRSIGYDTGVVLPVEVTPQRPGAPIDLRLSLDMGICREVCVPVNARASQMLLPSATQPVPTIRNSLAARPLNASEAGLSDVTCSVEIAGDGARLTARLQLPPMGSGEEIVFETSEPNLWMSQPVTQRAGSALVATATVEPPRGQPLYIDRNMLRITVIGSRGAAEIRGC